MPYERMTHEQRLATRWKFGQLKTNLIASFELKKSGLSHEAELPNYIDIGTFGDKIDACVAATTADPENAEHYATILFRPGKRVLVVDKDIRRLGPQDTQQIPTQFADPASYIGGGVIETKRGFDTEASRRVFESLTSEQKLKFLRVTRNLQALDEEAISWFHAMSTDTVGILHAHKYPSRFSSVDVLNILMQQSLAVSLLGSPSSEHRYSALVRTRETPRYSEDDAQKELKKMGELYAPVLFQLGIHRVRETNAEEGLAKRMRILDKARALLLPNIAKQHHLGYYEGSGTSIRRVE